METKHVVVGTAGHIDHGKSALVEALTGTHPDRLEEEKRRGITIDLGFAFLGLEDLRIGFVDVPGHERFVRNMLAGAGGIDMVLLVVAADESIKPQTREHFDICRLLGISRGLVAITKSDLIESSVLELVRLQIDEFIRGSFLEGAPIVPVSARTGAGLDLLRRELLHVGHAVLPRGVARYPRLPIDRSFAVKGFGTVATGTLVSGTVRVDDELELYPTGQRLRVRGLHSGGKSVSQAVAGQRTAVNLSGIDHAEIRRGMELAAPGIFEPALRLDARVTLLSSAHLLKNRSRVHFHSGTAEALATIDLEAGTELSPGESGFARIRLNKKILLLPGDRFIFRQYSPVITIGGGVVLDPRSPRHRRNGTGLAAYWEILEHGSRCEILGALVESASEVLRLSEILARTGWLDAEICEAARELAKQGSVRMIAEQPLVLAPASRVTQCSARLRAEVDRFHQANPLLQGIPRQDLRGRAGKPSAEIFGAALDDLLKAGTLTVTGDLVQGAGRSIVLSPEESQAKELIEREFERAAFAVPSISAVLERLPVEPARAQKILQILLREKVLVKLADDLIFHQTAVARLRKDIAEYRARRGTRLSVSAFKELTGVTRKYAIPLLEYLDRERVTRRVGDERVIL
jgi:selenocysteine-specific elongation factor